MTQISNNIYCSDFLLDIDVKTKLLPNPYYDYPYLIIKDFLSSHECDDINEKVKEDDDYQKAQIKNWKNLRKFIKKTNRIDKVFFCVIIDEVARKYARKVMGQLAKL